MIKHLTIDNTPSACLTNTERVWWQWLLLTCIKILCAVSIRLRKEDIYVTLILG